MKLIFDARVLSHKTYTGVENYTKNILQNITARLDVNSATPKTDNKYLAHLWTHFILPFKCGDILFCPANIAPLFVPRSKKLVVTVHDVAFLSYPDSFSSLFRSYYQWLVPKVIHRADKIITISQASKKEILRYYPFAKNKIEVISLGLDNNFHLLPNIEQKNQILYVGSLNTRKNFTSVIQAFDQLPYEQYQLVIVGNFSSNFHLDKKTQDLLEKSKRNPNIEFKSHISDNELTLLYNESKLFLFPSFYEGFGLPPLEAMACGTPVITSNLSSMPEVCGDAAIYIDPHSVEDISQKIQTILSNEALQQKLINKGLEHIKQFTWEKATDEHIKVFKEVLEK